MNINLQDFLYSLLLTILNYSEGVIPAFVIAWIVDWVAARLPFARPFRDAIRQWLLSVIDQIKKQRTAQIISAAEQRYIALQKTGAENGAAKGTRNELALKMVRDQVEPNRERAAALIDAAVADMNRRLYENSH